MSESIHQQNASHVFRLKEVLALYQRGIDAYLHRGNGHLPVMVQGIAVPKKGGKSVMGTWQYFIIEDRGLTFEAKAQSTVELLWNREARMAVLLGMASWGVKGLVPQVEILSVISEEEGRKVSRNEQLTKWEPYIRQQKRDVEVTFGQPRPSVGVLTSGAGEAWTDLCTPLAEYKDRIEICRIPVRVSDPESVGQGLRRIWETQPTPDLVVLTRGGGETVHDLDSDTLLQLVTQRPIPLLTAIGHTRDHLILDQLSDKSFATPRDCGLWLRDGLARARSRHQETQDAKVRKAHQELLELTGRYKQQEQELRRAHRQKVVLSIFFGATLVLLLSVYLGIL
ncbi:MAG: hypothetical protein NPIRA04_05260 [Nitrospirales bacterium]|nr:MAG: hypothetical protein NPIRA04_05260 [Nitrospirales bacterium]